MKLQKETSIMLNHQKLYRMGLTDIYGIPEKLNIDILASILSGEIYDEINKSIALDIYKDIKKSIQCKDDANAYKTMQHLYELAEEKMPKVLETLSKDNRCLNAYLLSFMDNWQEYLTTEAILEV